MIAAVYARKSTEQNVTEDAKSVTRQTDLARAFAVAQGWTVADEHVFVDDGISGAEFLKLTSRARMLAAAERGEFGALVIMNEDRLSRDDEELPSLIYTLRDDGVSIWRYTDRAQVFTKTALDRGMLAMRATFAAAEREAAQQRTREALRAKAKGGHVAGGKVYGYTNVREGSNTARQVNETEAAVIRRIFELTGQGLGLLKIAKRLNAEGIPSPRGDGWATTAIREMLRRELYRGRLVYGKTTWARRKGRKFKVATPEAEWLTSEAPELVIVSDELWQAAHARIDRTRATHSGQRQPDGRLKGRPESGLLSNHLLSGFLRCGTCKGNMFVAPRSGKRGEPQLYYVCTTHHKRGNTRCTNRWGVPYHDLTDDVLKRLKSQLLNPAAIEYIVTSEMHKQAEQPDEQKAERDALRGRLSILDREIARYTRAVSLTDDVKPLVEALQVRQQERADVLGKLEHLDGLEKAAQTFDVVRFRQFVTEMLAHLEITLYHPAIKPQKAREILRGLLRSPIEVSTRFDEAGAFAGWEWAVLTALDSLLVGVLDGGPAEPAACPAWSVTKPNATMLVPPAGLAQ